MHVVETMPDTDRKTGKVSLLALLFSAMLVVRGTTGYFERSTSIQSGLIADGLTIVFALVVVLSWRSRNQKPTAAGVLFFVYLGVCVIATIPTLALSDLMAFYGLRSLVLAPLIILGFQAARFSPADRRVIGFALLAVVLANCVVATQQAIFGYSAVDLAAIEKTGSTFLVGDRIRLIGLQQSGQDLSVIVGAAFVWGLYQLTRNGFRKTPALVLVTTAYAGVITFLVLQRSVLLGVGVAVFVLMVLDIFSVERVGGKLRRLRRLVVFLAFGLIVALIMAAIAPEQFGEAITRATSLVNLTGDRSWAIRQASTIPVSLSLIAQNPWGYGVGTSGAVAAGFDNLSPLAQYVYGGLWADSGYFFMALQVGVIGTLFWLAFLAAWAIRGRLVQGFETSPRNALVVLAFLAGSMSTGSFWGLASTMVFTLMFTSIDVTPRTKRAQRRPGRRYTSV